MFAENLWSKNERDGILVNFLTSKRIDPEKFVVHTFVSENFKKITISQKLNNIFIL